MFDITSIREYQIEITTYCNAACPQCPRNINGGSVNPYLPLGHLEREVIDRVFDADLLARLDQIFFCGSYGDPIMHPDFLAILSDLRRKAPDLWLYAHTNGGAHASDYWQEMASIMAGHGQIDFGIDGLASSLPLYRRNVEFDRVIENARAFIQAGGRAQWNFIVFEHNEHEIDQARELSQRLGFYKFLPRRTGRFYHHTQECEIAEWPVMDRAGQVIYHIRPPGQVQWQNPSVNRLPDLRAQYGDLTRYWDTTPITCDAAQGRKVVINAQGLVLPCNFFNHNLYDARFYDSDILPGRHALHDRQARNQVRQFLESHALHSLDIHHHSLAEIFDCAMWSDLVRSWTQDFAHGRLFECAMTCGEKFTKVWDQGGSTR